jgi:hypothetical protein
MAADYSPAQPVLVASLSRQAAVGSGTQSLLTWVPGMDSLLAVDLAAQPALTGGSVVAQALYVDPTTGATGTADLINASIGTGTTTGVQQILAQGDQLVVIQVTPTDTGAVTVNASITLLREGA